MQTILNIAYIAGLFDGEGSLGIFNYYSSKGRKPYQRIVLRIFNTHLETLNFVKDRLKVGCVCKGSNKSPHKQIYVYHVANNNALRVLRLLRPYLHIKANKADEMLKHSKGHWKSEL